MVMTGRSAVHGVAVGVGIAAVGLAELSFAGEYTVGARGLVSCPRKSSNRRSTCAAYMLPSSRLAARVCASGTMA